MQVYQENKHSEPFSIRINAIPIKLTQFLSSWVTDLALRTGGSLLCMYNLTKSRFQLHVVATHF